MAPGARCSGGDLPDGQLSSLALAIPVLFVALVATRFLFVFVMATLSGRRSPGWVVAAWAGTRGPVSALAAFTLPVATDAGAAIPDRSLVISITFVLGAALAAVAGYVALSGPHATKDQTTLANNNATNPVTETPKETLALSGDRDGAREWLRRGCASRPRAPACGLLR